MGLRYDADLAVLEGQCAVEDAGELAEWLIADRTRRVDLAPCGGMHAAVLQTLMALRPPLVALPDDADLARWLSPALPSVVSPMAPPLVDQVIPDQPAAAQPAEASARPQAKKAKTGKRQTAANAGAGAGVRRNKKVQDQ